MTHYKMRHYKNTILNGLPELKLWNQFHICHYFVLMSIYIQWTCILLVHYTIVLHTPSFGFFIFTRNQVFLVNPKMMSDLILHPHSDLMPLNLVLLPQSLRIQHMSTDTQLARAHDYPNLDGFVSPCHHQAVTQICHWVCPFFHCTSHLKRAEAESTWHHLGMPF